MSHGASHLYSCLVVITNVFCYFEDAKNNKKRKFYKSLIRYFTYFGMDRMIFMFLFSTYTHVLEFIF